MKGNYESENKYATGRIVIGTKPTLVEFENFTSKIDKKVIDLVIEYLDVKDCLNEKGMKLSADYNKKVEKEESKMPKKKVTKKKTKKPVVKKKATRKKATRKKATRKRKDSSSAVLDVLGKPSDIGKSMRKQMSGYKF